MRGLTILGVICAMSACSIRAVTFLPPDAADTSGRGGETGADGGRDIVVVDAAREVAPEVAVDVAPEARPDLAPDTTRDVVVDAPVDQVGSVSDAAVDTVGDASDGETDDASDASDDSSGTPPGPVCGNGIREGNEECDDGMLDTATCNGPAAGSLGCRPPECGDEYTNTAAGEECDTGLDMDTPTCIGFAADPAFACTSSRCGDGYVNTAALEACDDRNTSACGTCSADCSTSQPGGDCPLGTGCASIADCNNSDCRGVCVQAP